MTDGLRHLADAAALRVLGQQDRNPYSPTRGCFDRRFWAWKLVDYPEATFQRHVYPLSILYRDSKSRLYQRAEVAEAIADGLRFAVSIQHRNGSFDQAFPYEQSWGATAFLLQPMLEAFSLAAPALGADADRVRDGLSRAGTFLAREMERHGRITNHLAGGALSLLAAAEALGRRDLAESGRTLVDDILASQSSEGWFPEYGGADPGYQTLCLYYLSEIARIAPTPAIAAALDRTLEFLQWFVHPDGTLGGLYGSRRTRVAYLAGFALLADRSNVAYAMLERLAGAAVDGSSVSAGSIDEGNLPPVFTSVVRAAACAPAARTHTVVLPCDRDEAAADFRDAGLYVRSVAGRFAVFGAANGGTLTVFDRASRTLIRDDGGYVGKLTDGALITSQVTRTHAVDVQPDRVSVTVGFSRMAFATPSPAAFLILRLLNLTLMRSIAVGNIVKRMLARHLMAPRAEVGVRLRREVRFGPRGIGVEDRVTNPGGIALRWLRGGRPFNSIHMASAGYADGGSLQAALGPASEIDIERLAREREVVTVTQIA